MMEAVAGIGIGAGALAAITAFLVGARKIGAQINAALRRQDQVNLLLERELGNDGNGSLKNRLVAIQETLQIAKQDIDHLQHTVDDHVLDVQVHVRRHDDDPHAHQRDDDSPDAGPAGPR